MAITAPFIVGYHLTVARNWMSCSDASSLADSRRVPSATNDRSGPSVQRTPVRQVRFSASDSDSPANGVARPRPPNAPSP